MPERDPVKRVAMLVELESGATAVLFAQPDPALNDALVYVQTSRPPADMFRDLDAPPEYRWHVNGLHEYRAADNMPTMVRTYLDSIATAVHL